MCGIAGFWQKKRRALDPQRILSVMGATLVHRGPDDAGFFCDNSAGVGFAFRRLSIVDLSPAGHQPMTSSSQRFVIIFNGEIYNFEEIRAELGPGYSWKGHSDTEVALEAIERWGLVAAVQRFVGMFAITLWDSKKRELHLVRDRLGIKPVYYGRVEGDFVFASELKAIHQYPGFAGQVDRDSLALFMRHNYVPAPHSIYKDIHKLEPGCILTLSASDADPVNHRFWSASEIAREGVRSRAIATDAELIEQLEQKLMDAVRLRMIADVPLGAFLSGGIDSSTIVALMQSQSSRPIKTFTIGFHEDGFNEAQHAKQIAGHLGTDHTELYVTAEEAMKVVPELPSMYDEPFADSSQIPTFLVSRLARQSVTVSLSGDGGDELFAGYNRYSVINSLWKRLKWFPSPVRKTAASMITTISPSKIDSIYGWVQPVVPKRKRLAAVGDKAHKLAQILDMNGPHAIYLRALSQWTDTAEVVPGSCEPDTVLKFIQDAAWLPTLEELMMLTDTVNYLPDDILTKVDRASMAVSLEARVPILDHRVVEFAWKLPMHLKVRDGVSKWILRQVLYKYVPKNLIDRPKMGFGVPIDSWLRGPLRPWADELLSEEALQRHGLFNAKIIQARWHEHLSGGRNWQYSIWTVLMFQDWFLHNAVSVQAA